MQDSKHVILCVDDDRELLQAMRMILESADYIVLEALSAEEGLRVYKEGEPDALILDLMMEEVDAGVGMVTQLKALGNTAPIFMLSSVGDGLAAVTSYAELGLAGVFQKPADADRLLSTLKARLR